MKILQLCEYYQELGGTERYVLDVSSALEEAGHSVCVAYGKRNGETTSCRSRAEIYAPEISAYGSAGHGLSRLLLEEKPDVIYIHNVANGRLIRELSADFPCVRYVHDHRLFCPKGDKLFRVSGRVCSCRCGAACFLNAYAERCLPRAPWRTLPLIKAKLDEIGCSRGLKLLVASAYMRDCLLVNGVPRENIETLPYYCGKPSAGRRREGNYILFAGRVIRQKGLAELLAAVQGFPEGLKLLVAGEGDWLPEARSCAEGYGVSSRVGFLGRLNQEELSSCYEGCLAVAVPSMWGEPFGIIGIEAMSHGRPVVAFDVGGVREWLSDGVNGLLVPRGDSAALGGAILRLASDADLRGRMGEAGRLMHARRFTKEAHIKRLTEIFLSAVKAA